MKDRKKPDKFVLPHRMPSDDRAFAFSSRVFPKAAQIKAPYKLWHYQKSTQVVNLLLALTLLPDRRSSWYPAFFLLSDWWQISWGGDRRYTECAYGECIGLSSV